ncbi:LuxR C-terminal-related transcriptional regulator [Ornithinimicrobium faecis]|uniref:LuxR C-terminal-related transcriptional regulator n=1 Tax=Ornithinimicrobium faecis TaxID=2934158 RepID=A0ABY4YT71_9MICO|nr:LuxR C-terminal-related transcriptional regulator [Ornithinimicrobium sp. HY1793]USQ79960.1 LuxR C-terminal-related transcriptional regulator [Ornithinimicrobium sp. HY1793]
MPEQAGTLGLEARARAPWPFAGRAEEFEIITSVITSSPITSSPDDRAAGTPGCGAVLVAPAGVGKTRLLAEVRDWAEQRGMRTATVIATEAAARTPYGAVLHLLPPDTVDPMDRTTWHASFAAALRGGGGPTLLVVDEAQHLDPGSAALVLQLAIEGVAVPVVAVRRGEQVHDSITALWKNSLVLRVDLQPFSATEMRALISQALGGSVSSRALTRLAAVCDGNVLYARELVVGAIQAGSLQQRDGIWTWDEQVVLAPRLVEAVGARLTMLTEQQREALAVVALGEPLPPQVAEAVVAPSALAALEELGLIRTVGADLSTVLRLAHPLHGEVALSELGGLARRHLLTRLADVVDHDGWRSDESVFRTVSWRLEAGDPQSPHDLLRAAVRANQAFDSQLAERLARAGLASRGSGGSTEQQSVGEALTVELALALMRDNRHAEAHTLLEQVEDAVVASADRRLQDAYLDTRFWVCGLGLGHVDEVRHLLNRYAEAHPGADGAEPGLTAYRANLLLWEGRPAAALALAEPLVEAERGEVSELQRMLALETCSEALVSLGLHIRAARLWDQLRAMAVEGTGRALSAGAEADLQALWAAQLDGRYDEILPVVSTVRDRLENSPDVVTRGLASMALGRILVMTGQLARAHGFLLDAVADFRRVDLGGTLGWTMAILSVTAAQTGRPEEARRWRDQARTALGSTFNPRQAADLAAADVWLAVAEGDSTTACSLALEGAEHYPELQLARAWQLHLAVRVGERGPRVATALREIADRAECTYPALLADHVESLRAGDGQGLEEVAERFAERGLVVLAAEAATQAVTAHRARGSTDGARRATARATSLTAQFDALKTPALEAPQELVELSRRELDVARLAADGLTNAAIADRLVVSVRTVESHLYQAFAKLGVERRTELRSLLPAQVPPGRDR